MQILHRIDDFTFSLFNEESKKDLAVLKQEIIKYYTYGPYKPKVTIDGEWIKIDIDVPSIVNQDPDYRKVIALCEKGKYYDAKKILEPLIKKNPTNSDYHRIYGQILSDEGDPDGAIDSFIDALKWDPKNAYALIMMGNVFARNKDDVDTAMKYYDQAVKINPGDNIAVNNIGGNLLRQEKFEEAKKYFERALALNQNYPNTHYGLALIAEKQGDLQSAFTHILAAIKSNKQKDALFQNSLQQAINYAQQISKTNAAKNTLRAYLRKLESDGGKKIETIVDDSITTAAKFEFAENHNRDRHIIRYNPKFPAAEHLEMHELVHLDLAIQARNEGLNQLFITTQAEKTQFIKGIEPTVKKLSRLGYNDQVISDYCTNLFDGINRQIFNTPIDLFIENFLYLNYPELRPYQFLSLYALIQEGLKAVTDTQVIEISPKDVLSKSKIYNIVSAKQFADLFGINLIDDFKANLNELKHAEDFYNEFLEYKNDKGPGEEYELIQHWAQDLKLDKNFELVNEETYRNKRTNLDNLIESIEKDPFDIETKDPFKEKETEKFLESQKAIGTNMAVVMYMVDALKYFKEMDKDAIKQIAIEIAMQGTQGYHPQQKGYRLPSIPKREFSGYHILAYYYISWKLAIPEMISQLNLPYDKEYELARQLYKEQG